MKNSHDQEECYLFSDKPIESKSSDVLGREKFAKALAKSIAGWKSKDSLVIGLYGSWGNGKTSIKNLTLKMLPEFAADMNIVEFNPWTLDGSNGIIEGFFNQLGDSLKQSTSEKLKEASKESKSLATFFKAAVPLIGIVADTITGGGGSLAATILAPVDGIITRDAEMKKDAAEASFYRVKNLLSNCLSESSERVLIVVDDVDRLTIEEIKTLFRLIKNVADFPNVTYLLLFDKTVVEKSLSEHSSVGGKEYLQKIVQVDIDIPVLSKIQLKEYISRGFKNILGARKISFDEKRLNELVEFLPEFARNLRSIHRLLNSFAFHISVYESHGDLDVNPIDLLGLETIRVFENDVFKYIYKWLEFFAPNSVSVGIKLGIKEGKNDDFKKHWENLEKLFSCDQSPSIKMMTFLFPSFMRLTGQLNKIPSEEQMVQELRLCHERLSRRYFHFEVEKDDLTKDSVDTLIGAMKTPDKFECELKKLANNGLLVAAIGYLVDHSDKITSDEVFKNSKVLLRLTEDYQGPNWENCTTWCYQLFRNCLLKEEKESSRSSKVLISIKKNDAIDMAMLIALSMESSNGIRENLLSKSALSDLKSWTVKRIKTLARKNSLLKSKRFGRTMYLWNEWGDKTDATAYIEKICKTPQGLLKFTSSMLTTSYHGDGEITRGVDFRGMLEFISFDKLRNCLKKLKDSEFTSEEIEIVNLLRKSVSVLEKHEFADREKSGIEDLLVSQT